jgi:hypothetical protein
MGTFYFLVDGDLHQRDAGGLEHRVCHAGGQIAVAFDRATGLVHRHGEFNEVKGWEAELRSYLERSRFDDLAATLSVAAMPLTDEAVAEVNRCLSEPGLAIGLGERAAAISRAPRSP